MNRPKLELSDELCPKCKKNRLYKERVWNSLSRRDNKTYICNDCGREEAFEDLKKRGEDA